MTQLNLLYIRKEDLLQIYSGEVKRKKKRKNWKTLRQILYIDSNKSKL